MFLLLEKGRKLLVIFIFKDVSWPTLNKLQILNCENYEFSKKKLTFLTKTPCKLPPPNDEIRQDKERERETSTKQFLYDHIKFFPKDQACWFDYINFILSYTLILTTIEMYPPIQMKLEEERNIQKSRQSTWSKD